VRIDGGSVAFPESDFPEPSMFREWSGTVVQPRRPPRFSERGQALLEYAMVVALIGACLVAILGLLGRATNRAYKDTASTLSHETGSPYGGSGGVILTGGSSAAVNVSPSVGATPPDSSPGSADSTGALADWSPKPPW